MVFEGLVGYAIAVLFGLALAEYTKIVKKNVQKPFSWIMGGAILILVSSLFALPWGWTIFNIATIAIIGHIGEIVGILGFIAVLVGGLWAVYELLFG